VQHKKISIPNFNISGTNFVKANKTCGHHMTALKIRERSLQLDDGERFGHFHCQISAHCSIDDDTTWVSMRITRVSMRLEEALQGAANILQ
jgi:hypothetical protein